MTTRISPLEAVTQVLRAIEEDRGISGDSALARELGVSRQAIYRWRRGHIDPSTAALLPIVWAWATGAPRRISTVAERVYNAGIEPDQSFGRVHAGLTAELSRRVRSAMGGAEESFTPEELRSLRVAPDPEPPGVDYIRKQMQEQIEQIASPYARALDLAERGREMEAESESRFEDVPYNGPSGRALREEYEERMRRATGRKTPHDAGELPDPAPSPYAAGDDEDGEA